MIQLSELETHQALIHRWSFNVEYWVKEPSHWSCKVAIRSGIVRFPTAYSLPPARLVGVLNTWPEHTTVEFLSVEELNEYLAEVLL